MITDEDGTMGLDKDLELERPSDKDLELERPSRLKLKSRKLSSSKKGFLDWYNSEFLCSRDPLSPVICSENKAAIAKFRRIGEIANTLLNCPQRDIHELREEVALKYMVSMRISLDYINLAKLVLKQYNQYLNQ